MKPVHTDRVTYRWTAKDALTVVDGKEHPEKAHPKDPKVRPIYVTPYCIIPGVLPGDAAFKEGDSVTVPLDRSNERWSVDRFFVDGLAWEQVPPEVTGYSTIGELCNKLAATLPARFAHLKLDGKPAAQRNQTALLLFDYWQNTDYRLAVVKDGFDWTTLQSQTETIATEKGGQKLTWVLGKKPEVKPINATPDPDKGKSATVVVPDPAFEVIVTLSPEEKHRRISALGIANGMCVPSFLVFDIEIKKLKSKEEADETILRVKAADGSVIFEETRKGEFVKPGKHQWLWDGYSSKKVLDTALLRKGLQIEVVAVSKPAGDSVGKLRLEDAKKGVDWLDVRLVPGNKRAYVDVYLIPLQRSGDPLPDADYRAAMGVVTEGIDKHWSRTTSIDGTDYRVDVVSQFTKDRGIGFTIISTDDPSDRSCNLRVLSDSLSVWYYYCTKAPADEAERVRRYNENRETAAHEFGHSVIGTQPRGFEEGPYSMDYSLTHKGTSWEWQKIKSSAPNYPASPEECDVMFYYQDWEPDDAFDRVFGSADDVRHMLTLAQVDFQELG